MIQVLNSISNLAKVNTVLFRTASRRLDSLAYIESLTDADAYSQYLVNDIEHTVNNKQCQKCKLSLVPIT